MGLAAKITQGLTRKKWELADLARASGVPLKTLFAIVARDSKRSVYAPQIAAALGYELEDFFGVERRYVAREPTGAFSEYFPDGAERKLVEAFRQLRPSEQHKFLQAVKEAAERESQLEREMLDKIKRLAATGDKRWRIVKGS